MSNEANSLNGDGADFLLGGGEMGKRIRSFNWSKHPLGPIEHWPQSLKIVIRIMLTSRYAMWMGWGPEFYFFCNDSYLPTVGIKERWVLGASAKKVWEEIWLDIGPRAESVVKTGRATWDESLLLYLERSGYPEETYHTFSYSPIPDDDGSIGGMLCVVTEDTERVIGERRLAMLRELASDIASTKTENELMKAIGKRLNLRSKDLPFAMIYLFDGDAKHAALRCAAGTTAGDDIAPSIIDLNAAENVWPATEILEGSGPMIISDLEEKFVTLPTGPWDKPARKAVVVPIAQQGQERSAGFLVTGINPYRPFDTEYSGFINLLAGQIAAGLSNARAYDEERKRAEALAELDRAKTTFFSNVSHEFRTPLTLMLGPIAEILARPEGEILQESREMLTVAHRNGQRLLKLVNTLLDFSRIEAGRAQAVYEPVNLSEYTAELASVFRAAIEKAGMRLVVDCQELPEQVFVDRDMWEKITLNLLSNAFKYTLAGEIRVSIHTENGQAILMVQDTGTGIPESELPKIFNRFHRVEGARGRTHEGTGIGLALVQELVKFHGGTVKVESRYGEGSTFIVAIPFGKSHLPVDQINSTPKISSTAVGAKSFVEEALRWLPNSESEELSADVLAEEYSSNKDSGEAEPNRIKEKVLLADDNADMRDYVRRLLSAEYQVIAVKDGSEALQAAIKHKPDLVITDVMMPYLDGFGLLKSLREDQHTASIPVIMLSARAGQEARIEGLEAGADDYLIKPFSARELMARVGGTLALAKLRRESLRREEELKAETTYILESLTEGFIALDRDFRYVYLNAEAERIYQMRREDVIGKTFWDVFPSTLGTVTEIEFRRAMSERIPVRYEVLFDLWKRWFEVAAYPTNDGGIAIYFRDITQQKQTDAIIQGQKQALEMAVNGLPLERILETLTRTVEAQSVDKVIASILLLDADGLHLRHGAAPNLPESYTRAIDGVKIGPMVGSCGTAAFTGKPVIASDIATDPRWSDYRELALAHGLHACWSTPIISSQGKTLGTFALYYREVRNATPEDQEIVGLLTHTAAVIIERDQESRERAAAESLLREADRRKDEFLAMLAHELRNPLAPLRNGLQIIRLVGNDGAEIEQAKDMMERQLQHMVRLIDDLLDMSRISRGKIELQKQEVDLATVVKNAVETSQPLIERYDHRLILEIPEKTILVEADITRLSQIFANLLNNAAKYTERGGLIQLSVTELSEEVIVSVKDNGIGIPSDMLPLVFDMFTQVDRSLEKTQGGLGIGLNIAKRLAEMHGGTIEAFSQGPNIGSEFVVRLPLLKQSVNFNPAQDRKGASATAIGSYRILVTDDNEDSAVSLSLMLEFMGHEVRTANDGLEAVQIAAEFKPEVILMDIGMPNLNGYDACRRIREHAWGRDIYMIALTGWGQEEDRRLSLEAGFNRHLVKPVEPTAIEKILASFKEENADGARALI